MTSIRDLDGGWRVSRDRRFFGEIPSGGPRYLRSLRRQGGDLALIP